MSASNRRGQSDLLNKIPDDFKACLDWEEVCQVRKNFVILTEDEFYEQYLNRSYIDTFCYIASSMQNHLSNNGFGVDSVNTFNALLTAPAINILVECTSQELVSKGYERTNANKMLKFLATKFLRSRIHVPSDVAWSDYLEPLAVRYNFQLMEITRFNRLLNSIRGFDIDKRNADNNDTWMQRKNLL